MGAVNELVCNVSLENLISGCEFLRVPIAEEKTENAKQCIVFAGIELDSVKMELRLPLDKLIKCRELVKNITGRKI